ncbi:putative membrane protein [Rhodoblastus acidophilus]|uniref:Putative membrane protein n=1 Tax=Rhodoblastus acidophilus TaxID=1074 RepID=A0A212S6E8_RHOAC|nr:phage holin family protein [Rhodoblastus acidophilus]MCW2318495.1 putative membrane protein [Rhodoblastus acidophilus]PPQ37467.1 phage holin family protein [Rhodoblastus acidophilus]RAI18828.1 phage holin family protein [Rhodoblastus acidophilus]SNB80676.1 putative membrane protein [Rhodoblastus acidophilus]
MIGFLLRALIVAVGLYVASRIVPGVSFASTESLLWAAVLLGLVNAVLRPVLIVLTIPITVLTFGLFLLVINGLMIELVAHVLDGFFVSGLGAAILAALVVSVVSWLVSWSVGPGGVEIMVIRR